MSSALDRAPILTGTARLEDVGKGQRIYVTDLDIPGPGRYFLLAEPVGGTKIQGLGNIVVEGRTKTPAVGDRAFPSKTPTLADAPAAELTTRTPPDTELLRVSVADALARKEPFVVTKQLLVSGMGQLHVEVVVERMKRKVQRRRPPAAPAHPHKETVKGRAEGQGKYKKQTGGRAVRRYLAARRAAHPRRRFRVRRRIFGGAMPATSSPRWRRASATA